MLGQPVELSLEAESSKSEPGTRETTILLSEKQSIYVPSRAREREKFRPRAQHAPLSHSRYHQPTKKGPLELASVATRENKFNIDALIGGDIFSSSFDIPFEPAILLV